MAASETSGLQDDRVRLHIAPFNADLYDRLIPPSLQPLASNCSFHTVQTFPERGYGFVELPVMDAQKLKKKLNGSTLRGTKMSVEEARPAKKRKSDVEEVGDASEKKKAKRERKERKQQKDDGVLTGHELEDGRRVKRGWTGNDSKDGKKKGKSERNTKTPDDENDKKLRFKTKVPANKTELKGEQEKKKTKDKKARKHEAKGQVIVEEHTKRRKLRSDVEPLSVAAPGSTVYQEGKGWVHEDGDVVEAERKTKRRKKQRSASPGVAHLPDTPMEDTVAGAERDEPENGKESMSEMEADAEVAEQRSGPTGSPDQAQSGEEDEITHATEQPKEVHPLEALFKRPAPQATDQSSSSTPSRPRPARIDTSFSFFGAGDGDVEMADSDQGGGEGAATGMPPVTPHTKQDLEWRSLRSAAPTPDTAAIGRKFSFPFAGNEDDEEAEEDDDDEGGQHVDGQDDGGDQAMTSGNVGKGQNERGEESAFRKWFFENRGDLNRGWKKRRREERKMTRQRENRRLGRKLA